MHKSTSTSTRNGRYRSDYDLQADLETIKDALATASIDVKGRVGEIMTHSINDMRDKSIDAKEKVEEYVTEQPLKSLGLAVLGGLLLAFLIRR